MALQNYYSYFDVIIHDCKALMCGFSSISFVFRYKIND